MSEENIRRTYSKQERTGISKLGKRYILSNSVMPDIIPYMETDPEKIKTAVKNLFEDLVEYAKFQKMIYVGEYKQNDKMKDEKGPFIFVYKKGESQRVEALIGSRKVAALREIPLGPISEIEERIELVDEDKELIEEDIEFANNVYGSSSMRETSNKDTREIDINFLIENGATGKRHKKETRSLNLEEMRREGRI